MLQFFDLRQSAAILVQSRSERAFREGSVCAFSRVGGPTSRIEQLKMPLGLFMSLFDLTFNLLGSWLYADRGSCARFSQHISNRIGGPTASGECLDLVVAAPPVKLVCVVCNCHNGMPSPLEDTENEQTICLEMLVYPDGTVIDRVCRFVHSKSGEGLSIQAAFVCFVHASL